MTQQTPLYIVASPKPRVGKTLIARLLIEYFRSGGRPLVGYDLQPRDPALASRFPDIVATVDITDTRGQMALFDRLITDNERIKVIDLGYAPFDQFFAVMAEIGFLQEARRRLIEPIMLFVTDTAATTVRAYADLRRQLPAMTFVPVHNEGTSLIFNKGDFPPNSDRIWRHQHPAPVGDRTWRRRSSELFVCSLHDRATGRTDGSPQLDQHNLHRISRTRAPAADGSADRLTRQRKPTADARSTAGAVANFRTSRTRKS